MDKISHYDLEKTKEVIARKERNRICETVKPKKTKAHIDYNILAVILVLVAIGLIIQYSTTYHLSYTEQLTREAIDSVVTENLPIVSKDFLRQLQFTGFGLLIMYLTMRFWKPEMKRVTLFFSYLSLVAAVSTGFFGEVIKGQRRWLKLGPFSVQPSDFFKIGLIFLLAYLLYNKNRHTLKSGRTVGALVMLLFPIGMVGYHDLSTGIVLLGIWVIVGLISFFNFNRWMTIIIAGFSIMVGLVIKFGAGYRLHRLSNWLDGTGDYQTNNGLEAILSGGLLGRGVGNSIMKTRVPEAENDFIFTIFCEEFGIIGGILLILTFVFLFRRIYYYIRRTRDRFCFLVLTGILMHLSLQVIINIGVTLKWLPNTGIGLPFISKGGSSIITFLIEMGILLKLSLYISKEPLPRIVSKTKKAKGKKRRQKRTKRPVRVGT